MGASSNKYGFFKSPNTALGVNDTSGDMVSMSKSEREDSAEFSENATLFNRIELRSKGYQVDALTKKAHAKQNRSTLDNDNGGGSSELDIEPHPELPYMGGKADQIILPDNEVDAVPESQLSSEQKQKLADKKKKQQEKQRNELSLRLKNKLVAAPKHTPKQRYVAPPPKHTPPKLRPPGG